MTGLLDKDLRILLQRRQGLWLFAAIAVIMSFTTTGAFTIGYTCFFVLVLSVSTISYDEFDNGYAFLMTLPITSKIYIAEKYFLCIISGCVGWLFSVAVCMVANAFRHVEILPKETLMEAVVLLPVIFLLMELMIPIQIKFGAEKSRVVLIAIMGICGISVLGIKKAAEVLPLPTDSIMGVLDKISDVQVVCGLIILMIAGCVISYGISLKIMNNKEY